MSRQAFESWCETILKDNPNWRESGDAELGRQAYQTATNAALERAAEVCDRAEVFAWEQWKATGNQHTEGVSDGAASLARDIRALKDAE